MLPRTYRLKDKNDFRKVYQRGKSVAYPYFVLFYKTNNNKQCRIGFSVSKKVGKAVVRNRIKRQFRELCRQKLSLFPVGKDYIIIVRSKALDAGFAQLSKQMDKALIRLEQNI